MDDTPSPAPEKLRLAWCKRCARHSFPATVHGCSHCGAEPAALEAVPLPQPPRLLNFVTVNAELAPGLPVPCVIGEVELAPGLVEEALINAANEEGLETGMTLQPRPATFGNTAGWCFVPVRGAA